MIVAAYVNKFYLLNVARILGQRLYNFMTFAKNLLFLSHNS